ncbi:hypothetical protein ACWAT4_26415 [Bradyrhizobium manausense]
MHKEHFHKASLPIRVPRGNEGFWEIMVRLNKEQGCFTVADVDGEGHVSVKHISKYLKGLVAAGFVEQIATRQHPIKGKFATPLYRLLKQPVKAPRVRPDGSLVPTTTAAEQLWIAMRNLSTGFSLAELVFAATTEELKPNMQTAGCFVRRLHRAGYLAVIKTSKRGGVAGRGGASAWRLKPGMSTGPLPPSLKHINGKSVWDPNLKQFVGEGPIAKEVKP